MDYLLHTSQTLIQRWENESGNAREGDRNGNDSILETYNEVHSSKAFFVNASYFLFLS